MKLDHWTLIGLCAGLVLLTAAPAVAQPSPRQRDPGVDYVSDLVVVAPASGPAWWKVSKGDAVVWVLGVPEVWTPAGLSWDRTTLKRRLKGARAMLTPAVEYSQFQQGQTAPLLPRDVAEKVVAAYEKNGLRYSSNRPPSVSDGLELQYAYYRRHRLTLDILQDVEAEAKRAGVPVLRPQAQKHGLLAADMTSDHADVLECMSAVIEQVQIPPERFRQVAARWAVGDVRGVLETSPKGTGASCRRFWPGHRERSVEFQTDMISQALETPGKVVAIWPISNLVAKDGILTRLKVQGYTVADPTRPLEE